MRSVKKQQKAWFPVVDFAADILEGVASEVAGIFIKNKSRRSRSPYHTRAYRQRSRRSYNVVHVYASGHVHLY